MSDKTTEDTLTAIRVLEEKGLLNPHARAQLSKDLPEHLRPMQEESKTLPVVARFKEGSGWAGADLVVWDDDKDEDVLTPLGQIVLNALREAININIDHPEYGPLQIRLASNDEVMEYFE